MRPLGQMPIYFKYISFQFCKNILLTLTIFTLGLCIAELAFHLPFKSNQMMLLHLTAVFFKRLEILLPLSFLIGIINTLSSMQKQNQVILLEVSGFSKSKISTPFFLISLVACLGTYLCNQYILPKTSPWLLEELKLGHKTADSDDYEVRFLPDGSRIIYTPFHEQLINLYWIRSHDEIWHCEQITFEGEVPVGMYVDKIQKNSAGQFLKTTSFHRYALPNSFLKSKPKVERSGCPSISTLFTLMTEHTLSLISDKGYVYSLLCYKMINPWFPTMVVTGFLPFLLPFRKHLKTINLYLIGTLSLFLFHTLVKACIILAEHYVVSPLLTIIFMPLLLQSVLSLRLWSTLATRSPKLRFFFSF